MMMTVLRCALFPLLSSITLSAAMAQPRMLNDAQWREDISATVNHIRATHPKPFRSLTAEEFDARVVSLENDLPALSDKDIALRLAALVGALEDGHSRLSLPRQHPELAFSQGHTGPDAAAVASLSLATLPVRFYLFDDGLHITQAARGFEHLIGAKVTKIGETSVEDAITTVKPILFAENPMGVKLLAADRLALPEVLKHFGLVDDATRVSLTIEHKDETQVIDLAPLAAAGGAVELVSPIVEPPVAAPEDGVLKWHGRIPGERAWYIRIDEIEAFPDYLLADFMADALKAAKRARARRIILDLRNNQGGTASFNAAIINAVAQSEYNDFGQFYVLIGRETFSAATMLVSHFERYTNAILVGEPSSGRPSSYGDPEKLKLPNSGLTVRVSTIYWQSWLAGDFREFVETHIDAPPLASKYFAGDDPAIEAALAYAPPDGIAAEMAELFDKEKLQSGIVRFLGWLNAPIDGPHNAASDLVAYGHRYLDDGALRKGRFMMVMAREYYPNNANARAGLGRALELKGDHDDAVSRYEEALTLDPDNAMAADGLARLSP